jgi:hypothetical protein
MLADNFQFIIDLDWLHGVAGLALSQRANHQANRARVITCAKGKVITEIRII